MAQQNSYLSNLKFDPNLLKSFKAKYLSNVRLVILLVLFLLVVGVSSFLRLPKRLNPEIKIPIVSVTTVMPGAGPKDMESLVTIPLEDAINSVPNKTDIDSVSSDSISNITIQFTSGTDPEKAKQDVKSAIDKVNNLPDDATDPSINTFDFENQPVWIFALKTKADPATLSRVAISLQDKLKTSTKVDHVDISGVDNQEFQILLKPATLATYGVNPMQVSQAIKASLKSYPGGFSDTTDSSFPIGIDAESSSVGDIRNTSINLAGEVVKLGDIADVSEKTAPNEKEALYADSTFTPEKVVSFSVFKTRTSNIDEAATDAKKIVNQEVKSYGGDFQVVNIQDSAGEVDKQFNDLTSNFAETILLVFVTFLVFLGVRQALIVSITIPLTFLSAFSVMYFAGLSINFLSLFSLLLALGLLVDDSIVIITGITSYYKTGKFTPQEAGLLVWRDFIVPIWSTTITTVWAFIPLLIATGIIGEFIKTIPIVVAATLYSSTAIAVLITLPLMMITLKLKMPRRVKILLQALGIIVLIALLFPFIKGNPFTPLIIIIYLAFIFLTVRIRGKIADKIKSQISPSSRRKYGAFFSQFLNKGLIDLEVIGERYKSLIARILEKKSSRRKVILAIVSFTLFAYFLVPAGFVVNEFFPKSKANILYVVEELPAGTKIEETNKEAKILANDLRKTAGTNYVTTQVGSGIDASGQSVNSGNNILQVTLNLPDPEKQKVSSIDLAQKLRDKYKTYTKGTISVVEESGGPPAGADLQIQISGDDLQKLDLYADKVSSYLNKQPGVFNVSKSIKPGVSKITFVPNPEKISENNLTIDNIGFTLRSYASGITVDTVKFNNATKSEDIVIRTSDTNPAPEELGSINVTNSQGNQIPLSDLGHFELKNNPTQITRHNNKRTISVSAGVQKGYSVTGVNAKLEKYADSSLNLADGYSWTTGGVNDENNKSVQSILQAMILAGILIFGTMVIQFSSYRQAVLVMLVIPIAISGVFIIFALTGTPLSFPALIGVLSLFGIVVTHAMVLVDRINLNRKAGLPFANAISDAAAARLEPIFLGSFTTIVGLVPITLSNPLWRGLGGAIVAGLSFSIFIMLFFVPTVYYMWFNPDRKGR